MTSDAVVVTGANGLVGAAVCAELARRGTPVRAVVRRSGAAPDLPGVAEHAGDFADPDFAAEVVADAAAVVATVHPMGSDRETQHRVGVAGTTTLARAARDAGASRFVHVSTAAVHDRRAGVGDVDEDSALVGEDGGDYPVAKRDAEAALGEVGGLTRVLVRAPVILGRGPSSLWNTLRPAGFRDHEEQRRFPADQTFSWVHVDDLAVFLADLATGSPADADDDPGAGPVRGEATAVLLSSGPARFRDYVEAVAAAVGAEPVWEDRPAWTGRLVTDRARRWGWSPRVGLADALAEVGADL